MKDENSHKMKIFNDNSSSEDEENLQNNKKKIEKYQQKQSKNLNF